MAFTDRKTRATRRRVVPALDFLEGRALLSGGPVTDDGSSGLLQSDFYNFMLAPQAQLGAEDATPLAGTYGATQLETAYGTTALGAANQGQGQTIGIIDVFSDSALISDVNTYSALYGLPQFNTAGGPTFTVAQPLGAAGASATDGGGNDTSTETSLDVDMAHAMAPQANILMVFVPAGSGQTNMQILDSEIANILQGVDYAASQGASVVSVSYGTTESSLGTLNGAAVAVTQNNTFLASSVLPNTVVTFSTGDSSTTSFPATSPNVIAVGGTSLHLSSAKGRYGYETADGGYPDGTLTVSAGGGPSTNFAAPSYQYNNGVSTMAGKRFTPDISLSSDNVLATALYDSYDGFDWTAAGGTSESSPLFAGVVALAQQQIAAEGDATLNSVALNTDLYSIYNSSNYSTDFHDITIGQNGEVSSRGRVTIAGFPAVTGYDEATGIGSPNAANLVPMLTSPGFAVVPGIVGGAVGSPDSGGQGTGGSDLGVDSIPLVLVPVTPALTLSTDGGQGTGSVGSGLGDDVMPLTLVTVAPTLTLSPDGGQDDGTIS
jgi:subtilase family serine protease